MDVAMAGHRSPMPLHILSQGDDISGSHLLRSTTTFMCRSRFANRWLQESSPDHKN